MRHLFVKHEGQAEHSADVLATVETVPRPVDPIALPTVEELYRDHADFVWASLHRLGVREADLPDQLQEVFVVVHRRLESFDGSSKATTWLFGICLRVAAAHRRRAHLRREKLDGELLDERTSDLASPEEHASARDAQKQLDALLDAMDLERRSVLVMFELEELSCREIAELLGIPVGTVHSRLHAARREFAELLAKRNRAAERRAR